MVGPKNLSNTYNSDLQHTNVITQPPEPLFSSWLLNVASDVNQQLQNFVQYKCGSTGYWAEIVIVK